jgi:RNA polymerase sigma-70 factor (ECF subfamily)
MAALDRSPAIGGDDGGVHGSVSPDTQAAVAGGSAEAFGSVVDPFRRELLVHCYRMLGTIDDAEDAVQEALIRAWRGRSTFVRAVSLKAWLYRIATTVCLDLLERRRRGRAVETGVRLGPIPESLLAGAVAGPEARHDLRESISLAFLTALHLLPPRQRAVLILRDVLSWHAAEVAQLLDLSVPAVNSALQRARATIASRGPARSNEPAASRLTPNRPTSKPTEAGLRTLLERYVRAWETADIPGLVALLRDDAVLRMPPRQTVVGASSIGAFLAERILVAGRRARLFVTSANGQPAVVAYAEAGPGARGAIEALSVLVLSVGGGKVTAIDAFADPLVLRRFGAIVVSGG